jgi:predicted ArsR family transcriptional regulator
MRAKNPWLNRLLAGSRGRVLAHLRQAPATISELSAALELSVNAVRSQLTALERDGLVVVDQPRRAGVGKPAHEYRITPSAGTMTPKAYDTLLGVVLDAAREDSGTEGYAQLLRKVVVRLAGDARASDATFATRLAQTRALLATIGADVSVEHAGKRLRLRGTDCPLASVVPAHPELCGVLAEVIAQRLGVSVRECCDRDATLPRCCFEAALDSAP